MSSRKSKNKDPEWVPPEEDNPSTTSSKDKQDRKKKTGIPLGKAGKNDLEKAGIRAEIAEALAQKMSSAGGDGKLDEVVGVLEKCGAECQVRFDSGFVIEKDSSGGLSVRMKRKGKISSSPLKKKKRQDLNWKPKQEDIDSESDSEDDTESEESDEEKDDRLDVNTAAEEDLDALRGIGPGLAKKIVVYREESGPFRRMKDLVGVKGISKRKLKRQLSTQLKVVVSEEDKILTRCLEPVAPDKTLMFEKREVVRLISWNLQCFSQEKAENDGVIEVICRAILENGISVAVLQEIADETAVNRIKDELNHPTIKSLKKFKKHQGNWECVLSDVAGPMFRSREYNAFIFDASRGIQLKSHDLIERPCKGKKQFTRRPFLGFFKAAKLDFVVVSVHLKATGLANEDIGKLKEELARMPDVISAVQERIPGEKDMIIVGDFNLEPNEDEFDAFREAGLSNMIANNEYTNISTSNMDGSKCYDNLWITPHTNSHYSTGRAGVIREYMSHPLIPDGWRMNGVVSDHCPVWAEFYCDVDTDKSLGVEDVEDITLKTL